MKASMSLASKLAESFVHLGDCAIFDVPDAPQDPMEGIQTNRDELIAYSLKIRPCYDRINKIIGQLAGNFILAYARERFDPDLPAVSIILKQMDEAVDAIRSIKPPPGAYRHYAGVLIVMKIVRSVTDEFNQAVLSRIKVKERLDNWTARLKRAHAILIACASQELGCMPVDFSQACCSCGVAAKDVKTKADHF